MSNNNISIITQQQTITSMEIAEITGRAHKNVLAAIRNMEVSWSNVTGLKFQLCERTYETRPGVYRKVPYYELNKKETLYVATKFNDEARAKLVLRWEQLEKERLQALQPQPMVDESNLPSDPRNLTRKQLLLMALEAEEERERLRAEKEELEVEKQSLEAQNYGLILESGQKDQQIQHLQQQTAYLNVIMADSSHVTITQIAQDYGMGAMAFNKLLNGLRIQRKVGEQWILYSEFINRGYVATRLIPIHHSGGPDTYKPLTAWTQSGRRFLYEQLKKHGVLPVVERNQPQAT